MKKRKLKTFTNNYNKLKFGHYILFQEYNPTNFAKKNTDFNISRPIMAIYLGSFVADMALGFNYVKWNNDNRTTKETNESGGEYSVINEVCVIDNHIEWYNYIDILGIWKNKPNWKQILSKYRKQNIKTIIPGNEIKIKL